ncbi:MAG: 2-amino-4-hydroxy-6-hydroxymethyldihydropteridine diphosphokinase [Epsilonproteobacteria bacterium]|nr:2-amino-4-hydroxy-6-hydroxymethyldihydropteridine diphosphokinase [Campylobacterota bacterium]
MEQIIKTTFFPYVSKSQKPNKALIGVGCNLGNCIRRFKKLFLFFQNHPKIDIIQTSVIYKNPPFGYLNQPWFYNTVMVVGSDYSPNELLNFLLYTEKKFGRKRAFKNSPRTLDLDIILYNNIKKKSTKLNIPHPYYKQRASVLVPLALKD